MLDIALHPGSSTPPLAVVVETHLKESSSDEEKAEHIDDNEPLLSNGPRARRPINK